MSTTRKKGGLKPHFEDVQAHYDLSDEFFSLFLDPTQTYSCAYFERDDMTLEEAQLAKVDLALGKLGLEPGMTLLDVGCGWGSTMLRAIEKYDVNVVGLTLSENQKAHVESVFAKHDSPRTKRVLLQGWEQFDEPVDRIVSIGAFEHFGKDRWDDFFAMAYKALPDDGVMLLHTITALTLPQMTAAGLPLTISIARVREVHPHRDLPGRLPADHRDGERVRDARRLQPDPDAVPAEALRQDAGHLVGGAGGAQGRGHRRPVRRGLRPLHALPHRLRQGLPRGLHRRLPVHARKK